MRGCRHEISDNTFVEMYESKSISEISKELGLPMTTVVSRLQTIGVYKSSKNRIELNDENVKYINEHTVSDSCKYFKVSITCMKNFIRKHNLSYIPSRVRPPVRGRSVEEKLKIRDTVLKMHETMTYKEIGALLNIGPVRVCQIVRNNYF